VCSSDLPTIGTLPKAYYLRAYNNLLSEKQFKKIWVFSDDIDSAREFLPSEMHPKVRWIGNIDDFAGTSLEIMRFGEFYILSNSTFGWWGAKLSRSESVEVFAPSPWFRSKISPLEILPDSWHTLPAWE
jgi:hypothetical protein